MKQIYTELRNINFHNVTHSLISQNPREWMFVVQISLFIVTFLSLISQNLSLMQTTKEVNPHPCIAPCVNMWSVAFFFFLCHIAWEGQVEWTTPHPFDMLHFVFFHNVTCYTNSLVLRIHVNTTKLRNIMCTLIATCVILWSLKCNDKVVSFEIHAPKFLMAPCRTTIYCPSPRSLHEKHHHRWTIMFT